MGIIETFCRESSDLNYLFDQEGKKDVDHVITRTGVYRSSRACRKTDHTGGVRNFAKGRFQEGSKE